MLGRIRPLEEIHAQIDALTPGKITEHLQRFPPKDFTIVTLGTAPLAVN
jgi:hypothetical protein